MKECTSCEDAKHYNLGLKGSNADETKIMFVLNHSDSRALRSTLFDDDYATALGSSLTGKHLAEVLRRSSLTLDDIYLTNIYKCLLPGDREPNKQEYQHCSSVFKEQVERFGPEKMILFGLMPFKVATGSEEKLESFVFENVEAQGIDSLVMYHPSKLISKNNAMRELFYNVAAEYLNGHE